MFKFNVDHVVFLNETSDNNIQANTIAKNTITQKESDINRDFPTGDKTVHVNVLGQVNTSGLISSLKYDLQDQTDETFNLQFENAMFRS